jgi:hypothetical protein
VDTSYWGITGSVEINTYKPTTDLKKESVKAGAPLHKREIIYKHMFTF